MKEVDILTSLPLNSSIGPVQTIKRLVNSKEFFLEHGYNINVFGRDRNESEVKVSMLSRLFKSPLTRKLMENIFLWINKHTIWGPKRIFAHYDFCARQVLDNYSKLGRKPDVIVFHFSFDCYRYLKDYRKDGVKIVYFQHDDGSGVMTFFDYPKARNSYLEEEFNSHFNYIMENIDVKACITRVTEKNLLSRFPVLKGKTCLVINGISDLTKNELEESQHIRRLNNTPKYRFICTGSISGRKGHREIIEALHRIEINKLKDIKVTFLGGGSERAALEKLCQNYKLQDVVQFVGIVPNCDVYKYQAKSNIAILISKVEGLPLALLEGMRSGLALVSTNVSGIPEIIENGKNGLLIEPNIESIVDIFNNLDKFDWEAMGAEGRKKFDDFYNFPRMRNDYMKMLEKALNTN